MIRQLKPSPPSAPSSPSLLSMASEFCITNATMVNSLTTHSNKPVTTRASSSPSVASTPTSKMASPSAPSATSLRAHKSNYCTPGRARWPAPVYFALWPYALRNAALLHNSLPMLEDGTSRLELFSSIGVGANMKHMYTFGCPVFALQNALASWKQMPRWSPCTHLGLNLRPSPMHARNVYLVLNLSTGCVSPQCHCHFDDFFETTCHNGPDVSGTITWQLLAGLNRAETIFSKMSTPTQHSVMYPETQSEADVPSEEISVASPFHKFTTDNYSVSDRDSHVSENVQPSEGATSAEPTVTADTSQRGRVCTMSQRMAESVAQGLHHMAHQSTFEETDEDLFHDAHLELQERMRNPIAFHAEMMGDIMYLQQVL